MCFKSSRSLHGNTEVQRREDTCPRSFTQEAWMLSMKCIELRTWNCMPFMVPWDALLKHPVNRLVWG